MGYKTRRHEIGMTDENNGENDGGMFQLFDSESGEMARLVRMAESDLRISLDEIVKMYYQVANVSAMARALKEDAKGGGAGTLYDAACRAEEFISERFDAAVHQSTKAMIERMVEDEIDALQSEYQKGEGGTDPEESGRYDNLRAMMSIREFIGQYDVMTGVGGDGPADGPEDEAERRRPAG